MRESVFEQMVWALDALGVSGEFERRAQPPELIRVSTGQRVLFRGADNPEKVQVPQIGEGLVHYLWFEELNEFSGMDDVRTIKASVLRGGPSIAFASYNPPAQPSSWVNEEAVRRVPGRMVHASTYLDLPRDWLGEAFVREAEMLRDENERAYRHMYLGEAVGGEAQVFEQPLPARGERCGNRRHGRVLCGLDFGFANDPDAFVRMHFDPARKRLMIIDEFVRARLSAEELARRGARAHGAGRARSVRQRRAAALKPCVNRRAR